VHRPHACLTEGLRHLHQNGVHHAEASHGRGSLVTLWVLVGAVVSGAGLCEFTGDLRMHKQALVTVSALREVLTGFGRMDKLTLTVLLVALGPEGTLDFGGGLGCHLVLAFRHIRALAVPITLALLLEEIVLWSLLLSLATLRPALRRCRLWSVIHQAESLLTLFKQCFLFNLIEILVGFDLILHVVKLVLHWSLLLVHLLFGRPRAGRYDEMILVVSILVVVLLSVPEFVISLILAILVVIVVFLESLLLGLVEILLEVFLERLFLETIVVVVLITRWASGLLSVALVRPLVWVVKLVIIVEVIEASPTASSISTVTLTAVLIH